MHTSPTTTCIINLSIYIYIHANQNQTSQVTLPAAAVMLPRLNVTHARTPVLHCCIPCDCIWHTYCLSRTVVLGGSWFECIPWAFLPAPALSMD